MKELLSKKPNKVKSRLTIISKAQIHRHAKLFWLLRWKVNFAPGVRVAPYTFVVISPCVFLAISLLLPKTKHSSGKQTNAHEHSILHF